MSNESTRTRESASIRVSLAEALAAGHLLLADGGTGTTLQAEGLDAGEYPELWNFDNPAAIRRLAQRYAEAGSDIVYTNTFGGNRIVLRSHVLADRVAEVNKLAVQLAREGLAAAGRSDCYVVGAIGPTGDMLDPYGDLTHEEARDAFLAQATALVDAGVDALVCESFAAIEEAAIAVEAARSVARVPVIASMTFEQGGRTMMGVTPELAVQRLTDAGAAVVGANCSIGPEVVEPVILKMRDASPETKLLAKPNAGMPQLIDNQSVFPLSPADLAAFAVRMKDLGIAIVGGCCGTNAEHIVAMARAVGKCRRATGR